MKKGMLSRKIRIREGLSVGSRSPSAALLGSFSRLSALVELKGDIADLSWNMSPWPFPELTVSWDAKVLVISRKCIPVLRQTLRGTSP